ncbi:MAG: 2OG-Fe(II) oxygenase [Azospirillaceae bacterium]|nr:2OG-Fe(II) oxygenase [Azospirillaceae bacterium]
MDGLSTPTPWERFVCGEAAPGFTGRTAENPKLTLDSFAGRHLLLGFFRSAADGDGAAMLAAVARHRALFDDDRVSFFGVTTDAEDAPAGRIPTQVPGIRHFLDPDRAVSRLYGAAGGEEAHTAFWLLLDPTLRVLTAGPVAETDRIMAVVAGLPPSDLHAGMEIQAPVLIVPRVFEPDFCRLLVALHRFHGGLDSGVMDEVDGKMVGVYDYSRKRRRDYILQDQALCLAAADRIGRRLVPQVRRALAFDATRLERHIVACYDAEEGGHFKPHRDNTAGGTAHRRFAVTVNLNAEDYEGGDLRFPEFGPRTYRAPTGGAVVFACGLLHEATPVTRGQRYAYLPFLYDEAGEKQRLAYLETMPRRDATHSGTGGGGL